MSEISRGNWRKGNPHNGGRGEKKKSGKSGERGPISGREEIAGSRYRNRGFWKGTIARGGIRGNQRDGGGDLGERGVVQGGALITGARVITDIMSDWAAPNERHS